MADVFPAPFRVLLAYYFIFEFAHDFSSASKVALKKDALGGYMQASLISNLFASGNALVVFTTAPLLSHLSDCFGRRPVLLYGVAAVLLSRLSLALGWSIFAYLTLDNLLPDAGSAVLLACVADVTHDATPARRVLMFWLLSASGTLGSLAGYCAHLLAARSIGDHAACAVSAAGFGAALALLALGLRETRPAALASPSLRQGSPLGAARLLSRLWPAVWPLFAVTALLTFTDKGSNDVVDEYNANFFGVSGSGYDLYQLVCGLGALAASALAVRAFGRFAGERGALVCAAAADCATYAALAFAHQLWQCYALTIANGLAVWSPYVSAMLVVRVPRDQQGEAQGAFAAFASLVAFGAPSILAFVMNASYCDWRGWTWLVAAAPAAGATILAACHTNMLPEPRAPFATAAAVTPGALEAQDEVDGGGSDDAAGSHKLPDVHSFAPSGYDTCNLSSRSAIYATPAAPPEESVPLSCAARLAALLLSAALLGSVCLGAYIIFSGADAGCGDKVSYSYG